MTEEMAEELQGEIKDAYDEIDRLETIIDKIYDLANEGLK